MDSDCERLVDEMWQSYLCEQNMGSFYEPSVSMNTQSGTQVLSQEDLDAINTIFTDVLERLDPLENLFDLLEEILLFEELEVECTFFHQSNADPNTGHQEMSKQTCRNNTTTENTKPTPYNKNEMENEVMENDHDTSMLKKSKKRTNNTTSDHNDGKKKKTISDE